MLSHFLRPEISDGGQCASTASRIGAQTRRLSWPMSAVHPKQEETQVTMNTTELKELTAIESGAGSGKNKVTTNTAELKAALQGIVGAQFVSDDAFTLMAYSRDYSAMPPQTPHFVVLPGNAQEVSQILSLANSTGTSIVVRGGGTTAALATSNGGIILDLNRMDKILKIDEDTMYLTAEGGCSIYSITKEIDKRGFLLAGRPMFGPVPTIGAWVNTVGIGGNCGRYGYFSENVTGIEVVLANGDIVRTGVNGLTNCDPFCRYTHTSDLTGLFVGSRGSLGVVTEVSTRIFPKPEVVNFITLGFTDWDPLIKSAYRIFREDIPATIDINDDGLGEIIDMKLPLPLLLSITVEGSPAEVERKIAAVRKIGADIGGVDMGADIGALIYYGGALTAYIYKKQGFGHMVYADAYWHTLDAFPQLYKSFKDICAKHGLSNNCIFGWLMKGISCIFPIVAYKEPEQWDAMRKAWKEICDEWFAVKNVGPGMSVPSPTAYNLDPLRPTHRQLLTTLKQTLDPNNIMNPKVIPSAGRSL